jgi:hypothetical protein
MMPLLRGRTWINATPRAFVLAEVSIPAPRTMTEAPRTGFLAPLTTIPKRVVLPTESDRGRTMSTWQPRGCCRTTRGFLAAGVREAGTTQFPAGSLTIPTGTLSWSPPIFGQTSGARTGGGDSGGGGGGGGGGGDGDGAVHTRVLVSTVVPALTLTLASGDANGPIVIERISPESSIFRDVPSQRT